MSGIAGIVHLDGAPVDRDALEAMTQAAAWRGPHGIHHWYAGGVGLAHLALHTTDESAREMQPLQADGGALVLTADARLDNRDELARDLAPDLPAGRAATDGELILAAYERWGRDCPDRLLGDFAFAIWDGRRRCLFAARDVMGMRALHYRASPGRLAFATEVKQLLALPDAGRALSERAIGAYLAEATPQPGWTFYDGIERLSPGHALELDAAGLRYWQYWDPIAEASDAPEAGDAVEAFVERFTEAVRCRLVGSERVGLLLSGGVDSGSIAAVAGKLRADGALVDVDVRTFSFAYDELTECDERETSGGIVRHYDLASHDVPGDNEWPLRNVLAHGPDEDEPYLYRTQQLMDTAIEHVARSGARVLLTGQHGDSVFGDWVFDYLDQARSLRLRSLWQDVTAHSHREGVPHWSVVRDRLLRPLPPLLWPHHRLRPVRRALRAAWHRGAPRYPSWIDERFARRIGLTGIVEFQSPSPDLRGHGRRARYARALSAEVERSTVLMERRLARVGLAYADPWADRRLLRFALSVPQGVLSPAGDNKGLVREAMRGIMPEPARIAMGKGSIEPLYRRGVLDRGTSTVFALLDGSRAAERGYVNGDRLREAYERFLRGDLTPDRDWSALWNVLTLEMWLRRLP